MSDIKNDTSVQFASLQYTELEKDGHEKNTKKNKKKKNKFKVQDDEVSSSTSPERAAVLPADVMSSYQPRTQILIKSVGKWFDAGVSFSSVVTGLKYN